MSGFTKGPWEWWTSNSLKRLSAGTKDGAVLHAYRCPDGASDIQVSDADARLIAAAPELLELAQHTATALRLSGAVPEEHGENHVDWLLHKIEAAIARATGEGVV